MIRLRKNQPKKENKKRGPKGYFEEDMIEEVYKLARFGLTNDEIADFYELNVNTVLHWLRTRPEFKKALQRGRLEDSLKAVASLHKQVQGYMVTETERTRTFDKNGVPHVSTKITNKHVQPNITATIYLLKTRHGDKWMDVFKSEINSTIHHKLDLSSLTTEDLTLLEKMGIKMTTNEVGVKQLVENAGRN